MRFALLVALSLVACVDGKTPDCSTPQSGCFPGDGGSTQSDASDGATDAATSDAAGDSAADSAAADAASD